MSRALKSAVLVLAAMTLPALAAAAAPPAASNGSSKSLIGTPVPASLLDTLQKASQSGLGLAVAPDPLDLETIDGQRVGSGNKVGMLYIGADFCPYCAGQRWVLLLTLLRFGKLDGVTYMMSSSHDAFPDTATFSFDKSTYNSDYVDFIPVETSDREGKKLMEPTKEQKAIYSKFDAPPYTQVFGGIPFVYIDGQYLLKQPMLAPSLLVGMGWDAIVQTLSNPQTSLFQTVMPQVNSLTAAICRLDGGDPDDVCSATGVTAANGALLNSGTASGS